METKQILFEGKIDGAHSQIFFDEEKQKWFLMQHIKKDKRNIAVKQIVNYNKGKSSEDRLGIVARMYKGQRSDFILGQISERKAYAYAKENKKNQIQSASMIQDVVEYSVQNNGYINKKSDLVTRVKESLVNGEAGKKVLAGVLAGTMVIGGVALLLNEMNSEPSISEDARLAITTTVSMPVENEEQAKFDLEDVVLKENGSGALTSDSVKDLSQGIENELAELYGLTDWKLPEVIESELLTSIFYFENSFKVEDSKDAYVGIGQMSKVAVKSAIIRADKIEGQASKKGTLRNVDNYILNSICSQGKDIDALTLELWEQAKTDPKMCGVLTALYLADLSDRYESLVAGNKAAVLMMYNAGEGNFQKYREIGLVTINNGQMTINVSNKNKLTSEKESSKYNEAENYIIKIIKAYQEQKENPNEDAGVICEQVRLEVGKNSNYSDEPNTHQYSFELEGLKFVGMQQDLGVQPGE